MFDDVIDVAALLEPIAGAAPQGRDLRSERGTDAPFTRLKDARTAAREAEKRAADPGEDGKAPAADWGAVTRAAQVVLGSHSKDLEAAAWLMEALVRSDGLRGLGAGARLVDGLVERYWGSLFPGIDEDEPDENPAEACTRALSGLAGPRGTLLAPLRLLPLFAGPHGGPVSLATYDEAVGFERLDADQQARRAGEGVVTLAQLDEQARADREGLAALARDAAAVLATWQAMEATLARLAGNARPNTAEVRTLLERIAGIAGGLAPAEAPPAPGDAPAAHSAGPAQGGAAGPIASREEALRRLKEAADWFRRNEPQSPLAYTLEEAVRRGRLTMPDLLAEIVPDYAARAAILTALGIRPPREPE
jgi:type VI secretion system protein ImpA